VDDNETSLNKAGNGYKKEQSFFTDFATTLEQEDCFVSEQEAYSASKDS
jgi:hypothetical protein